MEIETVKELKIGDIVMHRGELWRAELRKKNDCRLQCDMYDPHTRRCCGFCYRAGDDWMVFRRIDSSMSVCDGTVVKELATVDWAKAKREHTGYVFSEK